MKSEGSVSRTQREANKLILLSRTVGEVFPRIPDISNNLSLNVNMVSTLVKIIILA